MPKKENKQHVYNKTQDFFKKYKNIVIADVKDISTNKIQKIRHEIISLGETETLCGKTTVIQKSLHNMKEAAKGDLPKHLPIKELEEFIEAMPGIHLLLIFTNRDIAEIASITGKYVIEKQAKPGQISPVEIIIPAGPTGMDSSQIDYFQALKIPTKVMRNQLEITTATKILTVGQKITLSEINLMKKFNIKPYKHQMKIKKLLLNGKLYGEEILKVTDDILVVQVAFLLFGQCSSGNTRLSHLNGSSSLTNCSCILGRVNLEQRLSLSNCCTLIYAQAYDVS